MRVGDRLGHRLVKVDRPILRIPMLAIHLQRGLYTDGFKPNFQTNLQPLLASAVKVGRVGVGGLAGWGVGRGLRGRGGVGGCAQGRDGGEGVCHWG